MTGPYHPKSPIEEEQWEQEVGMHAVEQIKHHQWEQHECNNDRHLTPIPIAYPTRGTAHIHDNNIVC